MTDTSIKEIPTETADTLYSTLKEIPSEMTCVEQSHVRHRCQTAIQNEIEENIVTEPYVSETDNRGDDGDDEQSADEQSADEQSADEQSADKQSADESNFRNEIKEMENEIQFPLMCVGMLLIVVYGVNILYSLNKMTL